MAGSAPANGVLAQDGSLAAGSIKIEKVVLGGARHRLPDGPVTLSAPVGDRDGTYPLRGRDDLVETLLTLCRTGGEGRLHVLHGLGGCGKTAIALELVHRLLQRPADIPVRTVWWIDARHGVLVDSALRALAWQAGLGREQAAAGWVADALWERLSRSGHEWLLVVDNADDPRVLDGPGRLAAGTGWLRPHSAPSGLILITTRDGAPRLWGPSARLHPVLPLCENAATQVLIDHAGPAAGSTRAAQALARRLGALPLALRLAGAYLAEVNEMPRAFREPQTPTDFTSYREALDSSQSAQLKPSQAVDETWRVSVEYLHEHGYPCAGTLLDLLATFADAPIPYTLLLRPAALNNVVDDLSRIGGAELWATLVELSALGLLELRDPHDGLPTVSLHPLIRDASRARKRVLDVAGLMGHAQQLEELGKPEEPQFWKAWEAVVPHALGLLGYARDTAGDASLRTVFADGAESAARYLRARGMLHEAAAQFKEIVAIRLAFWGPHDPETLASQQHLARAMHDLGDLDTARRLYQRVWHGTCELLGDQHEHTLIARHELGRFLHDTGDLVTARHHLSSVLDIHLRLRGEDHAYTLTARHELARILHSEGQLQGAHSEYTSVLAARQRLLGNEHPRTLRTRHNLACVLHDLGRHEESLREFEAVLAARHRLLGNEHPAALVTQYRVGCVLRSQGERSRARAQFRLVEEITERTLGADHPHTRRAREAACALEGPPPDEHVG